MSKRAEITEQEYNALLAQHNAVCNGRACIHRYMNQSNRPVEQRYSHLSHGIAVIENFDGKFFKFIK